MNRALRSGLIIIRALVTTALIGPFLIPVPPLEDTVEPAKLGDADSQFITLNGIRVHFKKVGDGQPVIILLHGFAASVYSWHEVMEPLAATGTVIAFDRPAFGLTERPLPEDWVGDSPYSPEAQVELTIALMDNLAIDKAILVGNSAGGTISMLTALKYPDRVEALILVDPAVGFDNRIPDWQRLLFQTPQMQHVGPLLVRGIQASGKDLARSAWHDPSKITPEIWEGYLTPIKAKDWDRGLWEFNRASHPTGLSDRLSEFAMPVLVVTGDDDKLVSTVETIRLASAIPNAQLAVFEDYGHAPQEECPDAFLKAVTKFIANLL